jgi:hypothetical protein
VVANTYDYFIDKCCVVFGLETLLEFLVFSNKTFIGVFELNRKATIMLA